MNLKKTKAIIIGLIFLATAGVSASTGENIQDVNFRLLTIERRLDQMQYRIDGIERDIQNQVMSGRNESNSVLQTVLETQRQNLSLAEQVVTMQKQMLEMQKALDQLRESMEEKTRKETKPPAKPGKP